MLGRIITARLVARRGSTLPLLAAFTLAIALLAGLTETAYLSSAAAFERMIALLPTAASTVEVDRNSLASASDAADFERSIHEAAGSAAGGLLKEVSYRLGSRFFPIATINGLQLPRAEEGSVIAFVNHNGLASQVSLVAGGWSVPVSSNSFSITVAQPMARVFDLEPGDRLCVGNVDGPEEICAIVAGIWVQNDARSAYWSGDYALSADAEVSAADLGSIVGKTSAGFQESVLLRVDSERVAEADPSVAQGILATLRTRLGGNKEHVQVVTGLDAAVETFHDRSRVASFALYLIAAQVWIVGVFGLLFLARLRLERDRDVIAVWRTRGWPRSLVAYVLSVELGLVTVAALVPGVALGVGLAEAVTRFAYPDVTPALGWSAATVAPAVGAGLAAIVAMIVWLAVLAAGSGVVHARTEASRPRPRWWATPRAGAVAALLAVPILLEAQAQGDARLREISAGVPYEILLPGIAMALLTYAGSTLMPAAAALIARVPRLVEARLASLELARAAGPHQRLAVLVASAVALAMLGAVYGATAERNAADRAAYAAGADLRATAGGSRPVDLYSVGVPGVSATTVVFRGYGHPGSSTRDVQMLGVDPYTFPDVGWSRPGLMSPDLPASMKRLAATETGGIVLPATSTGLSLWVYGAGTGGEMTATLTDADLMPVSVPLGTLDFTGWTDLAGSFQPALFKAPLRLRRLTITAVSTAGRVAFSTLDAALRGGATELIDAFDTAAPRGFPTWWASDPDTGAITSDLETGDVVTRDGAPTARLFIRPGPMPVTLNPPPLTVSGSQGRLVTLDVPFLISSGLAAAVQVKAGDLLAVTLDNVPVNGVVAGVFDYFPTLYGDAMVFSLPPLVQVLGISGHPRPFPTEIWASGPPSAISAAAATLGANQAIVAVVSRYELEQERAQDPLEVAGRANLALGFGVACLLAIVAFGIFFAYAAAARAPEHAILRANGWSNVQLRRSLLIEQALVAVFAIVLGVITGAVLAIVLLPQLSISTSPVDTVPPTVLSVSPGLGLAGVALTLGGCLLMGRLVMRPVSSVQLMRELRLLG